MASIGRRPCSHPAAIASGVIARGSPPASDVMSKWTSDAKHERTAFQSRASVARKSVVIVSVTAWRANNVARSFSGVTRGIVIVPRRVEGNSLVAPTSDPRLAFVRVGSSDRLPPPEQPQRQHEAHHQPRRDDAKFRY